MKSKMAIVILVVVILLLGVALLVTHKDAVTEQQKATTQILNYSNELKQTVAKLEDQKVVNVTLTTNLAVRSDEVVAFSNSLAKSAAELDRTKDILARSQAEAKSAAELAAKTQSTLDNVRGEAAAAAKKAEDDIARREARISELLNSQDDLNKKIGGLNSAIGDLNQLIAKTEQELATTKGDKEFLMKELKRLQTEKADLERQMNDLAFLKEQVSKLKAELSIARRLDWIRRGIYGDDRKGSQILQEGFKASAPKSTGAEAPKLNVELKRDGTVTISPATNAPPAVK